MDPQSSLFDRLFTRPRPRWVTLGVALLLFLAPVIAAWAENALGDLLRRGGWRGLFIPPTIISYIFLVSPWLSRMENAVLRSFRTVVLIDDDKFDRLVSEAASSGSRHETLLFGVGALLGLLSARSSFEGSFSWLAVEWFLSNALMYGVLALTILSAVASARVTTALLRQPLRVDPFDTTPFEPIGRQSLLLALVFMGGISLSLLFVGTQPGTLLRPEFWLVYIPLASLPVVIFFLTMTPVHRVLAAARDREQGAVQQHLERVCRELLQCLEQGQETGSLSAEINALATYDDRLRMAATWPYNTGMLRTLVFSVLVPGATLVAKILLDVLLG